MRRNEFSSLDQKLKDNHYSSEQKKPPLLIKEIAKNTMLNVADLLLFFGMDHGEKLVKYI